MDEIENFLLGGQVEDAKEEFREYQFDPPVGCVIYFLIFLVILALGVIYAWRKGALEWV